MNTNGVVVSPTVTVSSSQSIIQFTKKEILTFKPLHNQKGKNGQALISPKRVDDLMPNIIRILSTDASPMVVFRGIEVDENGEFVRDHRQTPVIIEGHHRTEGLRKRTDISESALFPILVLTGTRTTSDLENRAQLANISHSKKSQVWQLLYSGAPFATLMFVPVFEMIDAVLKPKGYKEEDIFKIAGRLVAMILYSGGKAWGMASLFQAKKYDVTKPTWVNVSEQWQNDPTKIVDVKPFLRALKAQVQPGLNVLVDLRAGEHETSGLKSNIFWAVLGLSLQNQIGSGRFVTEAELAKVINRDASQITKKLCQELRNNSHTAEKWFKKHVKKYLASKQIV